MTLDRAKLAKVLGMLGSAYDGEALAAARRAHEMLRAEKLTWSDAVGVDAVVAEAACRHLLAENEMLRGELARLEARQHPDPWEWPSNDSEAIEVCLRYPQFCNGWERSFVVSLAGQRRRLTQKQCARLAELVRKIARCAR
jgi:hypothetical protein